MHLEFQEAQKSTPYKVQYKCLEGHKSRKDSIYRLDLTHHVHSLDMANHVESSPVNRGLRSPTKSIPTYYISCSYMLAR